MVSRLIFVVLLISQLEAFAQTLQFSDVKKLPSTINTKGEESIPLYSPDQNKLFFVRSFYEGNIGGRYAGLDIWISEFVQGSWKAATNRLSEINDRSNNILAGINGTGTILYSFRSSATEKLQGIEFSTFNNGGWSEPEFIPFEGIENSDFVGMFVTPEFDVMILSMRATDSRGEEDLYVSTKSKSGIWSTPRNMGATINSSGFEIAPFLSADRKRLYFASNGHGGLGDADIYYSERLYNSWETWSAPVNLGAPVNTNKFDAYFSIYGDSLAFFCSNRDQQLSDIYSAKVTLDMGVLSAGQEYLTQQEWNTIVGKNVLKQLKFQKGSSALTQPQKELLYFISKKVSERKDIGIHLFVKSEDESELTRTRLKELYGELRQAGIEATRIKDDQVASMIESSQESVIQIKLYREKPNNP